MKLICLYLFVLAGAAMGVLGAPFRTDINPALLYFQAFQMTPDLSPSEHDYLFETEWRGQKLPARFGELAARYDNQFKFFRQAAQATTPCDWGIDMTPGPATLLPHLARCKAVAQAARFRALWGLQNGRQVEVRDDLLAAFVLGRNATRDGTLISALVQVAVENIVCSTVAENFHQFSPETVKQLTEGFDAAPPRGTMAGCVAAEKIFFHDWMKGKVEELRKENSADDAAVMAGLHALVTSIEGPGEDQVNQPPPNHWEQLTKASGGTSEGILKLLGDLEPLYQRIGTIMALPYPDYEAQARLFSVEVENSTNPFVSMAFPAFNKCRQKEFAILAELAMVRAAAEYKLHGEDGLKSVTDPCGQGPFAFERFSFEGVDRGFELKSAYEGRGFPEVLIFVEKDGPPFLVNWKNAGQPAGKLSTKK